MIGKIIFWIVALLFIASLFVAIVLIPLERDTNAKDFCIDNGYENYEVATFKWERSYCVKINQNVIIKKEIQICNRQGMTIYDYCFVEMEEKNK